jgi:hypothetical protein
MARRRPPGAAEKLPPMEAQSPRDDSAPPRRRPRATEGEAVPPSGVPPGDVAPTPPAPPPLTGETPAPSLPSATPTPLPTPAAAAPIPAPAASPFEASYSGDWINKTFGSRGSAAAVITVDTAARTFQCVLTLGGLVFGVGTPPPQTFTGSYTDAGRKDHDQLPAPGQRVPVGQPGRSHHGQCDGPSESQHPPGGFQGERVPSEDPSQLHRCLLGRRRHGSGGHDAEQVARPPSNILARMTATWLPKTRPFSGATPEAIAKASTSGIATMPTTTPA